MSSHVPRPLRSVYNSNLAVPQVVQAPLRLKILTQRYPFDQPKHLLWPCITRYVIIILYSHTSMHTQSRSYWKHHGNRHLILSWNFCDSRYVVIFTHTQAWIHNQQNTGNLRAIFIIFYADILKFCL